MISLVRQLLEEGTLFLNMFLGYPKKLLELMVEKLLTMLQLFLIKKW